MRKGMLILFGAAAVGAMVLTALRGGPVLDPLADGAEAPVPVPPDTAMPELTEARVLPLPEGEAPSLSGTVLSAKERPVTGAHVTVFRMNGTHFVEPPFAKLTTDGAGQFMAPGAPSGPYALEAEAEGHGPAFFILRSYDAERGAHAVLRLAAPAHLAGRVVTVRGEPVPGAEITVRTGQVLSRFGRDGVIGRVSGGRQASTTANVSGDFRIDDLPPGIYDLTARAEGMVPNTLYSVRAPDDRLTVPLREGITVRGIVRWGKEDPPADLRLHVEPLDWRAKLERGKAEAAFEFDPLPAGDHRVKLRAAGFHEFEAKITLVPGETPEPLRIDLVPGFEARFTVTDADWGVPVPNARVVLSRVTGGAGAWEISELLSAIADGEGVAALRMAPGNWIARAELEGWFAPGGSAMRRFPPGRWPPPPGMFAVAGDAVRKELTLRRLYRIMGRVLDHDGRPVRAWVSISKAAFHPTREAPPGLRAPPGAVPVQAGEDGRFTIVGVVPFAVYTVRASAGRNNHAEATGVALPDGGREVDVGDLTVAPFPGASGSAGEAPGKIRGRILDERGNPVRGAVITARGKAANSSNGGTFLLEGIREGPTVIGIAAQGFAPTLLEEIEFRAGEEYDAGDIHLPRHGVRVMGRVLDTGRAPIPDARVRIYFTGISQPFDTQTDVDGAYEMEGPSAPLVPIVVTAEAEGFLPGSERDKLAGVRVVNVVLYRYAALVGRVSFRGEAPVRLAVLSRPQVRRSGDAAWARRDVALDKEGGFVHDRMPLGAYAIRLVAPGYAPLDLGNRGFNEGATVDLGRIGLNRGGAITGTVLGRDGEPAPGIVVAIRDFEVQATAGKDGSFRLERVPPGRRVIELRSPDGKQSHRAGSFTLEEGRVVKMNLRWPM